MGRATPATIPKCSVASPSGRPETTKAFFINNGSIAFVKEFNDKTQDTFKQYGNTAVRVPAKVSVYVDRSYDMELLPPIASDLIKYKAGVQSGSAEPNKKKVATVTEADLEEIATIKQPVMNTRKKEALVKSVRGTARSIGKEEKADAAETIVKSKIESRRKKKKRLIIC